MPKLLTQKTFRIELEITVAVEEVGEEHLRGSKSDGRLAYLKRLQAALLMNEPALLRQMLAAVFAKLQAYADQLVGQDTLACLAQTAREIGSHERNRFEANQEDFADLTRAIRVSCLSTNLDSSAVHEKHSPGSEPCREREVWRDLQWESDTGHQLAASHLPEPPAPQQPRSGNAHFLLVRYLTRQVDGVHIEGQCTCGEGFDGTAEDEERALERLWHAFNRHITAANASDEQQAGLRKSRAHGWHPEEGDGKDPVIGKN